eukprot:TRINITY_DN65860_c0_g1_i1.p1 TRINITY_DN65860_c0_g1~~TRINITY_DN65860_c0_g1_i1.p1  ORF type:complete len:320 (+),score=65.00 TRINITY_DN65860_c0_g1_i1:51-962(+)
MIPVVRAIAGNTAALATPRAFSWVLGLLCVTAAVCIITGTIFTYFHSVLPLLISHDSRAWWFVIAICTWLSFNLIFNYCMVVATKPGRVSPEMLREEDLILAHAHRDDPNVKGLWCRKCDAPRPFRAHHCPLCGHCVLKMDHHCPWINQCVGHYNHKYFVLFLVYLWLSVAVATVTISLNFAGVLVNTGLSPATRHSVLDEVILCYAVCIALTLVMTFFLMWTLYLVMSNQTTIEHLSNKAGLTHNIYDHKDRMKNMRVLFGPSVMSVFNMLLPTTALSQDNGHCFEVYSGLCLSQPAADTPL